MLGNSGGQPDRPFGQHDVLRSDLLRRQRSVGVEPLGDARAHRDERPAGLALRFHEEQPLLDAARHYALQNLLLRIACREVTGKGIGLQAADLTCSEEGEFAPVCVEQHEALDVQPQLPLRRISGLGMSRKTSRSWPVP